MGVPYTFANATTSIPLSQLDANFDTTITLGNTAIELGNTVTTLNNMTLANVTISSGTINTANATYVDLTVTGNTTLSTSLTGMAKLTTGVVSTGTAGTDYAKPSTASTWSASQRGTITTDNDGSFDQSVTNNFVCTPTGTFALTFTNHTAGQSGYVLLVNTGGYAITAAATTKVGASTLATISAAGTYLLSYFDNGTNAYVTASGALS